MHFHVHFFYFVLCLFLSDDNSDPEASELDLGTKIKTPKDVMLEELSLLKNKGSKMFKMRQQRVEKFIVTNENTVRVKKRKAVCVCECMCLHNVLCMCTDQTISISSRTSRTCWCPLPLFHQSLRCQWKKVGSQIPFYIFCPFSVFKMLSFCKDFAFNRSGLPLFCSVGCGGRKRQDEGKLCTHLCIALGTCHEGQRGPGGNHESLHAGTHPNAPRTASVQELQQVHKQQLSLSCNNYVSLHASIMTIKFSINIELYWIE